MKLGLGTVQFGLAYGVSNERGLPPEGEVREILRAAQDAGVRVVDTASQYGTSESVIGRCAPADAGFRIVSKTPSFKGSSVTPENAAAVRAAFASSLEKLRLRSVYGLLVHHGDELSRPGAEHVIDVLNQLKREGLVAKVGVSVYSGEEIDRVLSRFTPDIVQVPLNIFDQRLIRSGHLRKLKEAGVEIHCRSVFLQGLLLMEPAKLNAYFRPIADHLSAFRRAAAKGGGNALRAAIQFVKGLKEVDVILVGVTALSELRGILEAYHAPEIASFDTAAFSCSDESMLNPALWKLA